MFNNPDIKDITGRENYVYISNALDEKELDWHLDLTLSEYHGAGKLNPSIHDVISGEVLSNNVLISTGQHPLYPKNSIPQARVVYLLEQNKLFAIGEIGLDKRCADFEWQKQTLQSHLDIAHQFNKPVIIHCVGYYHELLRLIKRNFPKLTYILHRFYGSLEMVKEFGKLNTIFSLHKDILKKKNCQLILNAIFENRNFGFETDVDLLGKHDVEDTIQELKTFYS